MKRRQTILLTIWTALLFVFLPASSAFALPNLSMYRPEGWSDTVVVSTVTGTSIDSYRMTTSDTLYVDWSTINLGSTATTARFSVELYVDDSLRASSDVYPPFHFVPGHGGSYVAAQDYSIGSLPAGTHTIRVKTDATEVIEESDETDNEYVKTIVVTTPASQLCTPRPNDLCLNSGRFRVQVNWRVPSQGSSGAGTAVPIAGGDTGYFWFFNSDNVELIVKVLDGRNVNGKFWVFYGALSGVEYTLTVTDTATGAVRSYFNPQGHTASVADTLAFDPSVGSTTSSVPASLPLIDHPIPEAAKIRSLAVTDPATADADRPLAVSPLAYSAPSPTAAPCTPSSTTLCLNGRRFSVQVTWAVASQGKSGAGTAVPLTSDSGYFWFFNSANAELVVKVLDGRGLNGNFWVFFGALSDVHYIVTITDTRTGFVRAYVNPHGILASYADTSAMTGSETWADGIARIPGTLSTVRALVERLRSSSDTPTRSLATHVQNSISALDQCLTTALQMGLAYCSGYDLTTGTPTTLIVNADAAQLAIGLLTPSSSYEEAATAVPRPSRNEVDGGLGQCLVPATVALRLEPFCNLLDDTGSTVDTENIIGDAEQFAALSCITGRELSPPCVTAGALSPVLITGSVTQGLACDLLGIVPTAISVQPARIRLEPGETAEFDLNLRRDAKRPAESLEEVIDRAVAAQFRLLAPALQRSVLTDIANHEFVTALESSNPKPEASCEESAPSSIASAFLQPAIGTGISLANRSVSADRGAQPGATATIVPKTSLGITLLSGEVIVEGTCSYSINPATSPPFARSGGSGSVTVTGTPAACAGSWTAVSQAEFISIDSGSSGSGAGPVTVNYSVSPNAKTGSRTGTMVIAGKTFTVTQDGSSSP